MTDRLDAIRHRLISRGIGNYNPDDDVAVWTDIAFLLAEIDTLHQRLQTAEQEKAQLLADFGVEEAEWKKLRHDDASLLNTFMQRTDEARRERDAALQRLATMEADKLYWKEVYRLADIEADTLRVKLADVEAERDTLRQQRDAVQRSIEAQGRENKRLRAKNAAHHKRISALTDRSVTP